MTKWRPKETNIASRSHGLAHGGIWRREPSSERALRALSISMTTRTEREKVEAVALPLVKYSHGLAERSMPTPLAAHWRKSGVYEPYGKSAHLPQDASWLKVTSGWPYSDQS